MTTDASPSFSATVGGFPRIGAHCEIHRAASRYWNDQSTAPDYSSLAHTLTMRQLSDATAAGLNSVPVGTFSYFDRMLDTAALTSSLPSSVSFVPDHFPVSAFDELPLWIDRYFAAALGVDDNHPRHAEFGDIVPLPKAQWFDTGFNHCVPELDPIRPFLANPGHLLAQLRRARRRHVPVRPALMGPVTYLALSTSIDGSDPIERLPELVDCYLDILDEISWEGFDWIQLDEPVLNTGHLPAHYDDFVRAQWSILVNHAHNRGMRVLLQTYFADPQRALKTMSGLDIDAWGIDVSDGTIPNLDGVSSGALIVAGAVNGRSVWLTNMHEALETLRAIARTHRVAVSTSCSLMHVPYSLATDEILDDFIELRSILAFGTEKINEVVALSKAMRSPNRPLPRIFEQSKRQIAARANIYADSNCLDLFFSASNTWVQQDGTKCRQLGS